jgi:hypothetical protein
MGSRRASGGAGEQNTGLVVGWVPVSPTGAFDVLDAGVRCLGASVVTRVAISTSTAGHQASKVAQSRQVSSVSAAST